MKFREFLKKQVEEIEPYSDKEPEDISNGCITSMLLISFFIFAVLVLIMILFLR